MAYIPAYALSNLKKYSYKGVDKSIVSKYILNPFWNWFVTLWPLWVAPNTITLSGLSLVLINFITMLSFDPLYQCEKGGAHTPNWVYFTYAAGLFFYQAFDAIDGKQARRTGMASPLGEMFDHGCDALNTTLEALIASQALNLGRSWWTVASQIATLANFYLTTWEEYHTGSLYLGYFSGPVEGILMIVGVFVVTGIYGPSFWDTPLLSFLKLDAYIPTISSTLFSILYPIFSSLWFTGNSGSAREEQVAELVAKLVNKITGLGLNESFMVFGAIGLAGNIITSYSNVLRATRGQSKLLSEEDPNARNTEINSSQSVSKQAKKVEGKGEEFENPVKAAEKAKGIKGKGKTTSTPLLLLTPFLISATIQVLWLSAELPFVFPSDLNSSATVSAASPVPKNSSSIPNGSPLTKTTTTFLDSPLFVPFLLSWGLQFAHQVGTMILAHVTSTPFPRGDWFYWVWGILFGVLDVNSSVRSWIGAKSAPIPMIQSTPGRATALIYFTLVISLVRYGVFVTRVIWEVTEFLGIGCFRVVKKEGDGKKQ